MDIDRIISVIEQLPRYEPACDVGEIDVHMERWEDGDWINRDEVLLLLKAHLSPNSQ